MRIPKHTLVLLPDQDSINGNIYLWDSKMLEQLSKDKWIQSFEEHIIHLREIFKKFRKYGLFVKMSKCEFGMDRMDFLGHEVSSEGLRPNANKIKAIQAIPTPSDTYGYYVSKIQNGCGQTYIRKKLMILRVL